MFTLLFVLWEVFSRLCWHRVFVNFFTPLIVIPTKVDYSASELEKSADLKGCKSLRQKYMLDWKLFKPIQFQHEVAFENTLYKEPFNFLLLFYLLTFLIVDPTDTFGFQQKPDGCFIFNVNVCLRTFLKNLYWRYNIQQHSTQKGSRNVRLCCGEKWGM